MVMVNYFRRILFGLIILMICIIGDIISSIWAFYALIVNSPRYWSIVLGKDQTFNAATGGDHRETLSHRSARAQLRGDKWGCVLCKFLDYIEKDHCKKSLDSGE